MSGPSQGPTAAVETSIGTFRLSPLTALELREALSIIARSQGKPYNLDRLILWLPLVLSSINKQHPEVTKGDIEKLTLGDFINLFVKMCEITPAVDAKTRRLILGTIHRA